MALHEIGHSLGLTGHSTNPQDVMYKASRVATLSSRDLETVRALYQQDLPASNIPGVPLARIHQYVALLQETNDLINQGKLRKASDKLEESKTYYSEQGSLEQFLEGYLAYRRKRYKQAKTLLTTLSEEEYSESFSTKLALGLQLPSSLGEGDGGLLVLLSL